MVPLTYAVKDEAEAFSASVVSLLREVFNYVVRSAGSLMLPFVLGVAFFRSGLRREEDVDAALALGVQRVILGTAAVERIDLVGRLAARFGDQVIVGVDARDGMVATAGWTETADIRAVDLVRHWIDAPPADDAVLLNVNVPDLPYERLGPPEVVRLGKRHKAEPVIPTRNPRGETVYWVGAAGAAADAGPGTDFYAVKQGRVAITPLQLDLTHTGQLAAVRDWLGRKA
jgi:hypothetical protein